MLEVAANFRSETRDFVFSKRVIVFLFLTNVVHYRGMRNIQNLCISVITLLCSLRELNIH